MIAAQAPQWKYCAADADASQIALADAFETAVLLAAMPVASP